MITKYLNLEGEAAIESVSTMALMLGEDPAVACESDEEAQKTGFNFKEKIKSAITKIKEWIQRVLNWVKEKLYGLFKVASFQIDQKMWNDGNTVLGLCNKIDLSPLKIVMTQAKTMSAYATAKDDKVDKIKTNVEESITRISSSQAYKDFVENNYDNKHLLSVKGQDFTSEKDKFETLMLIGKEGLNQLESTLANAKDSDVAVINVSISMTNLLIKIYAVRVYVLSRFISVAGNLGSKTENDKK